MNFNQIKPECCNIIAENFVKRYIVNGGVCKSERKEERDPAWLFVCASVD